MESVFFRRSFWGIVLVIIGILWLMQNLFDFDFPMFRVLFSLGLVAIGILLIRGYPLRPQTTGSRTIFGEAKHTMQPGDLEHSVVFGEAKIDLTSLPTDVDHIVNLKCVFGEMKVLLPTGMRYEIKGEFAFSSAHMPDGSTQNFGQKSYSHDPNGSSGAVMRIYAHCTFGNMIFFNS